MFEKIAFVILIGIAIFGYMYFTGKIDHLRVENQNMVAAMDSTRQITENVSERLAFQYEHLNAIIEQSNDELFRILDEQDAEAMAYWKAQFDSLTFLFSGTDTAVVIGDSTYMPFADTSYHEGEPVLSAAGEVVLSELTNRYTFWVRPEVHPFEMEGTLSRLPDGQPVMHLYMSNGWAPRDIYPVIDPSFDKLDSPVWGFTKKLIYAGVGAGIVLILK